jgi:formylglycine-generating enzyme required for sulfatase activity
MVWIPGGSFLMGSDAHYPEEAPAHTVIVEGFWMDRFPVTNAELRRFVEETGYRTVAERAPDPAEYPGADPKMLVPGSVVFQPPAGPVDLSRPNWWAWMPGACWRHPEGPGSSLAGRERHPVVHIAFADAEAYAAWAGKRLPSESEWERAARGGLEGAVYAWGDELAPRGRRMANYWQGEFPHQSLSTGGFAGTSPVGDLPANGYGLHDMIGNVWEWTTDWYQDHKDFPRSCCAKVNPRGGSEEKSHDPRTPHLRIPRKVLKGGSYLCAANYCARYRPAARIAQQIETGTCHQGFRCVR